ncbi:H-NS family nucleoid-associated regulatory protein [Candidatus Vallotia lariciata]|uniref:H-NS family nucleoid-associated regulatory protein n=1 Tax=Candidatus Vallotia laricis TaxID=2018052 RepID=UPI001D0336C0|nr:H-NS family nucleoid-associated regulatory protein [Candidatus Vallotia lariciata]UDG82659.1 H-NS histone family protein [Candidatus Vallotia lariciata]
MDEQKRQKIIAYIHRQMAEYGISIERLSEALAENIQPILFRDAYGNVWDGKGEMPNWLKRAVYAGQSAEHFRVKTKP